MEVESSVSGGTDADLDDTGACPDGNVFLCPAWAARPCDENGDLIEEDTADQDVDPNAPTSPASLARYEEEQTFFQKQRKMLKEQQEKKRRQEYYRKQREWLAIDLGKDLVDKILGPPAEELEDAASEAAAVVRLRVSSYRTLCISVCAAMCEKRV